MTLEKEAILFTKYLTGTTPSPELINRYAEACVKLNFSVAETEDKYLEKILRWPFLLPFFDAALSLRNTKTVLRKKILVMLAVLETTPEYYSFFSSKNFSLFEWVVIFLKGIWAVVKFVVGSFILLFI